MAHSFKGCRSELPDSIVSGLEVRRGDRGDMLEAEEASQLTAAKKQREGQKKRLGGKIRLSKGYL